MREKYSQEDPEFYQTMVDIKNIAAGGRSIVRSMGSLKKLPFSFQDLNFIPAQVSKIPLNKEEKVKTEIVVGPKSKKPLIRRRIIPISKNRRMSKRKFPSSKKSPVECRREPKLAAGMLKKT